MAAADALQRGDTPWARGQAVAPLPRSCLCGSLGRPPPLPLRRPVLCMERAPLRHSWRAPQATSPWCWSSDCRRARAQLTQRRPPRRAVRAAAPPARAPRSSAAPAAASSATVAGARAGWCCNRGHRSVPSWAAGRLRGQLVRLAWRMVQAAHSLLRAFCCHVAFPHKPCLLACRPRQPPVPAATASWLTGATGTRANAAT